MRALHVFLWNDVCRLRISFYDSQGVFKKCRLPREGIGSGSIASDHPIAGLSTSLLFPLQSSPHVALRLIVLEMQP